MIRGTMHSQSPATGDEVPVLDTEDAARSVV